MEATTKDMRLHTRELLAAADRGEEAVITRHGRRRARLVRWTDEPERAPGERNPAFGVWADPDGDVDAEVRALRRSRDLP
jgi:antitoxin (DNA-binding transcriptional repressor) of toxin-antitoxin stability system